MTYDDLITYVPKALISANRDTVGEMENLVRRAQGYLVQRLDHDLFRQALPALPVDPDGIVNLSSLPGALLEIRSVTYAVPPGRPMPLLRRSEEMLTALFSDVPRGQPRFYTVTASGVMRVYPAPGRAGDVHIVANVAPPTLSPVHKTNIISEQFPELVELAVAMEAAIFNIDPSTTQLYQGRVQEALQTANGQISRRTRDENAQRAVETRNITGA